VSRHHNEQQAHFRFDVADCGQIREVTKNAALFFKKRTAL
jgi:hypothetical protein